MDQQNDVLNTILKKLDTTDSKLDAMSKQLDVVVIEQKTADDRIDTILAKVVGIAQTVKDNMFTKDEAREMESRLLTHIDGFIKLHETLDVELVALRSKYERLEERVVRVEQKVGIAA